jgi:hypothetical protein
MVMEKGFLSKALSLMEADAGIGGVGGKIMDIQVRTSADANRVDAAKKLLRDIDVDELGGGGLYRTSAINSIGYLAHRWLAAYEEAELGMRLRCAGYRLIRLHDIAVYHEGHVENDISMLWRLWRNGRAKAGGCLIRSSIGKPWVLRAIKKQLYVFSIPILYLFSTIISLSVGRSFYEIAGLFFLTVFCFLFALFVKKRNIYLVLYSFFSWHFLFVAVFIGLFEKIGSPFEIISSKDVPLFV